jgi:4-hydroxy-tetrahydrodipicolinate reductase
MIRLGLVGANGRMGQAIIKLLVDKNFELFYAFVSNKNAVNQTILQYAKNYGSNLDFIKDVDVVIDFSNYIFSLKVLEYCKKYNKPVVIGTTGFNEEQLNYIKKLSNYIPILQSPNMSISVNVLFKMAQILAKDLQDFEVEILESHHRNKKDSPSGTALKIGEIVANSRGFSLESQAIFNRSGRDVIRSKNDIGFSVIRGGDIVGKHELMFINDGEMLSLTSEITNRDTFARGALIAADYIIKQKNGLYNMFDVISFINK